MAKGNLLWWFCACRWVVGKKLRGRGGSRRCLGCILQFLVAIVHGANGFVWFSYGLELPGSGGVLAVG